MAVGRAEETAFHRNGRRLALAALVVLTELLEVLLGQEAHLTYRGLGALPSGVVAQVAVAVKPSAVTQTLHGQHSEPALEASYERYQLHL